ncbi:hypothetical protein SmJEL517_g02866 [Synchytrium microbalum]|uniref:Rho-GAP domain-containing protein n=1 Tax=Synchytrium microbalum TaxID=1806994 RepID=A0A507C0A3_9FUNG|nr:uncharacterized protein SmJEL517_g02866 [Synchytrium microbalum]TPX34507.1 hypothetical protein SmJEL517_g02866 [Synchytrium microbalum]
MATITRLPPPEQPVLSPTSTSGANGDDAAFVEITDPQSGKVFFANVLTGDCTWDRPLGKIKPKDPSGNEWWELYDENHKLPYYYNTKTKQTEWVKPTEGTILPLIAIQNSAIGKQVSGSFNRPASAQSTTSSTMSMAPTDRDAPSSAAFGDGIYTPRGGPSKTGTLRPLDVPTLPALRTGDAAQKAKTLGISDPTANPDAQARMAVPQFSAPSPTILSPPSTTGSYSTAHEIITPFTPTFPVASSSAASSAPPSAYPSSSNASVPQTPSNNGPPPGFAKLPHDLKAHINQFKIEGFAQKYFSEHRRGLFRRKVPMTRMLKYQKDPIRAPLMVLNKNFHKDSLKTFRYIQKIMTPGPQNPLTEIQAVLDRGIMIGGLRDEIYVQICKQMTDNPSIDSVIKGWMLLCAITIAFPPSKNFEDYMKSFIEGNIGHKNERIDLLAKHCQKKYLRICKTGPRGKTPTITEIERAQEAPFVKALFGETLDEIMRTQEEQFPDLPIPRVLPFLADAILSMNGCKTEGIFRVPGDADAVTDLKCRLEKGNYDVSGITDANVPGSLLKFWLRDLADPLIPSEYYAACVEVGADENKADAGARAVAIADSLPEYNRRVVYYVIRFLRVIAEPQNHAITKMTHQNIAMVFAPNFLRCPSEDPTVIFNSTKYEQGYLRVLLTVPNLPTH